MSDPTLPDVIGAAMVERMLDMFVAQPARVESYDATKQRIVAQPLIRRARVSEEGTRELTLPAQIHDVPVVFPGAGAYSDTWPLNRGDIVLLVFCDQSLDTWLPTTGGPIDPANDRRFNLNDAVAFASVRPFGAPISPAPPTNARVLSVPGGAEVRVGDASATGSGRSIVVQDALDDFMTALAAAIPGAGTAAPALTALQAQLDLLNGGLGWRARTAKGKAT